MIMFSTTLILPAADSHWEVWRMGSVGAWQGSVADPLQALPSGGSVIMALPARSCRTFAFTAPTDDPKLVRKLSFAQLEKRGLTTAGSDQTPFDCRVIHSVAGRCLVSVDIATPEAISLLGDTRAKAALPSIRLFNIPQGRLVVMEEHGRLILVAGCGGRALHSQIISAKNQLDGAAAQEVRIAILSLQQQGIVDEIVGVDLWGDFPSNDVHFLQAQLELPVAIKARPAPDPASMRRESGTLLLPLTVRQSLRRRRHGLWRWAALAGLLIPIAWWIWSQHRDLLAKEAEAERMEAALDSSVAAHGSERLHKEHQLVLTTQARWAGLRLALEPRRYPVSHLNRLTGCLSAADVVLTRFESKVVEISVSGTARSVMDAYHYFNAVAKDGPLGVYAWTMVQPAIGADGSATFEMKGKMR